MHLHQLTQQIRLARQSKGLTQAALAKASGLSRVTINQIENGVVPDIGIRKFLRVLDALGLELEPATGAPRTMKGAKDYLDMLSISASTSYRQPIAANEMAWVLLSGKVSRKHIANLRAALDEAPTSVLEGALRQLSEVKPMATLQKNLAKIARAVKSDRYRNALAA